MSMKFRAIVKTKIILIATIVSVNVISPVQWKTWRERSPNSKNRHLALEILSNPDHYQRILSSLKGITLKGI
jgi:hypothetical protein